MSLEDPFWRSFLEIAAERDLPINELAAQIDAERGTEMGLATAIRLFVLDHYKTLARKD